MKAPGFWHRDGLLPALLAPASLAWRAASRLRCWTTRPRRAPVPVICIGNLVAGGAGKTPVTAAVAGRLRLDGHVAHVVTRGYGGRIHGPLQVDAGRDDAVEVGDEALILARYAPTWVARDRAAGAQAAAAAGAEVVVLDDGFQNPGLVKDLALVVVDGSYGFGNGRVMPAGPLREPVSSGLSRADAVILMGDDPHGLAAAFDGNRLRVLRADIEPLPEALVLEGQAVWAFAGIGRPAKFYETLERIGAEIVATGDFADHHRFAPDEIMAMVDAAQVSGARLVTTEKDWLRLPREARVMAEPVRVGAMFRDPAALDRLLAPLLGARGAA